MLSSTTAGIVLKFPTVLFVDIANFHDQYFISICKRGEGGGAISMIYSTRVVVLPPGGQLDIAIWWRGVDTGSDLEFVKKFTGPNFRVKEFYTLKMRKWRLFSPAINSENASLSVIWASFG